MTLEKSVIRIVGKPESGYDYSRKADPVRKITEDTITQLRGRKTVTTLWLMCCPKGLIGKTY